jgi:hypothetical protein
MPLEPAKSAIAENGNGLNQDPKKEKPLPNLIKHKFGLLRCSWLPNFHG